MRIFFHGNKRRDKNANRTFRRVPGFILPATLAALMAAVMLYCTAFALLSTRHKLLQKQAVEYGAELEQRNAEATERFRELATEGGGYAPD